MELTERERQLISLAIQQIAFNVARAPLTPETVDEYLKLQQRIAQVSSNGAAAVVVPDGADA